MTTRATTAKKDGGRKPAARKTDHPLAAAILRTPWANRSGAITTGGQPQALLPANPNRNGFLVQNVSAADLWINDQGDAGAVQPSLRIPANSEWRTPDGASVTTAVTIFGATAGQAFSCREW